MKISTLKDFQDLLGVHLSIHSVLFGNALRVAKILFIFTLVWLWNLLLKDFVEIIIMFLGLYGEIKCPIQVVNLSIANCLSNSATKLLSILSLFNSLFSLLQLFFLSNSLSELTPLLFSISLLKSLPQSLSYSAQTLLSVSPFPSLLQLSAS